MKRSLLLSSVFFAFALAAAGFPDPIGEFRGKAIPRSAVEEQLKNIGDLAPEDHTGRRAALRKALEEFCGSLIVEEIFSMPEYRDGRAAAKRYIAEAHLDEVTTSELQKQAESPEFIRKAILHLFLADHYGEAIFEVNDIDIETFYRQNIERFRIPENVVFAIIAVDDREEAETLHARLLQGENFERLAQESDDGRKRPQPTAEELAFLRLTAEKMKLHAISPVLTHRNRYFILKLQQRVPSRFTPLAKIKDSLKMELVALLEAKYLEKYLAEEIDAGNLILHDAE